MTIQERLKQETEELESLYAEKTMIIAKIRYAEKRIKITKEELQEITEKKNDKDLRP